MACVLLLCTLSSLCLASPRVASRIDTQPSEEPRVSSRSALFSVPSSNRSPSIYLVLELEKSLHGDYETAVEPYVKYSALTKDKDKEKMRSKVKGEAAGFCARAGRFRQPFGWSYLSIFNPRGQLLIDGKATFDNIYPAPKEPIPDLIQTTLQKRSAASSSTSAAKPADMSVSKVRPLPALHRSLHRSLALSNLDGGG
mgnify:CR=1 FL=1